MLLAIFFKPLLFMKEEETIYMQLFLFCLSNNFFHIYIPFFKEEEFSLRKQIFPTLFKV